jgi:hypothetical protein
MYHSQIEMSFEHIEVAVIVEELMAVFYAERGKDAVDRTADCKAFLA